MYGLPTFYFSGTELPKVKEKHRDKHHHSKSTHSTTPVKPDNGLSSSHAGKHSSQVLKKFQNEAKIQGYDNVEAFKSKDSDAKQKKRKLSFEELNGDGEQIAGEQKPPMSKKLKSKSSTHADTPAKMKKSTHQASPMKRKLDQTHQGTMPISSHKKLRLELPDEDQLLFPNGKYGLWDPVCTSNMAIDFDTRFYMPPAPNSSSKYGRLIHVECHPNGGASVVHSYQDELRHLSPAEMEEFVKEYFDIVYEESPPGVPRHVMGIVHGSATYMPDLVEYFAINHPSMVVKTQMLGKPEIETMTMEKYREAVHSSYKLGTYRNPGPLMQVRWQ